MSMNFQIGQQVVCVATRFSRNAYWRASVNTFPQLHGIYTIRDMCAENDLVGLYFCEIHNPRAWFRLGFVEPAFSTVNFRPVRKTSIEVFHKLLVPAPKELVPA